MHRLTMNPDVVTVVVDACREKNIDCPLSTRGEYWKRSMRATQSLRRPLRCIVECRSIGWSVAIIS